MKYIRYALLALVLLFSVTLALANRAPVTLALWPDTVTTFLGFGYSATLPLFAVVVGAIGLGLVLGLIWEWVREHNHRAEAARLRREVTALRETHPAPMQAAKPSQPRDQVLAILDEADTPR